MQPTLGRRDLLRGVGGAVGASGVLAAGVGATGSDPETITGTIRVSQAAADAGHGAAAHRVAEHFERAVELTAANDVEVEVVEAASRRPDLDSEAVVSNGSKAFAEWRKYVWGNDLGSRDFNLLITEEPYPGLVDVTGLAYVPGAVSVVEGAPELSALDPGFSMGGRGVGHKALNIALMELGHNLGMGHQQGAAWYEDGELVATPQITGYINAQFGTKEHEIAGTGVGIPIPTVDKFWMNSCGEDLPVFSGPWTTNRWRHVFSECAVRNSQLTLEWSLGEGSGPPDETRRETARLEGGEADEYAYAPTSDDPTVVRITLDGPAGADVDLFVTLDGRRPTPRDYDRRSRSPGPDERVTIGGDGSPNTGDLRVLVRSYDGGGEYELRIDEWV